MAKYVAAYIADGVIQTRTRSRSSLVAFDPRLAVSWKRLYCLFRFLKHFDADDTTQSFILYSDHAPPVIDGVLMGHELERLGVEIIVSDFLWRSDAAPLRPDYFIFDALEQLRRHVQSDDQLLLFGPDALVVQDYASLYRDLNAAGALIVEASVGEVSESVLTAYRDNVMAIRQALHSPCEMHGMMAVHPHFLGLSGRNLDRVYTSLKRLFPKNNLRAVRGEPYLSEPSELLAAIMSDLDYHSPTLRALANEVAAMPDELDILNMQRVPIFVPGYGREPDIEALFQRLVLDPTHASASQDPVEHLRSVVMGARAQPPMVRSMSYLRHHAMVRMKNLVTKTVAQPSA